MSQSTTANFSIGYTQYLNADQTVVNPLPPCASDSTLIIDLYKTMVLTRLFDTKAVALQRTGRLGTYPSSLGQEAIAVAIGKAMQTDDVLCGYYREYGAHLQRGVTMEEILLFWGGDERGSQFKNCPEDLPHCIPIASQTLHAAGIATAIKIKEQSRCAVAVIGDGGTSKGDFYEALNIAGIWKLPIVFIINNNQWAISVPRHEQTACETLAQKGIAAGIFAEQVDGNDIFATYDRIEQAVQRARSGEGPTVIEAITYRLCDHTTADDASRYRPQNELDAAQKAEPIRRLKHYLIANNLWSEQKEESLQTQLKKQVSDAIDNYLSQTPQPPSSMFDYLYETLPTELELQKQELHYDLEGRVT